MYSIFEHNFKIREGECRLPCWFLHKQSLYIVPITNVADPDPAIQLVPKADIYHDLRSLSIVHFFNEMLAILFRDFRLNLVFLLLNVRYFCTFALSEAKKAIIS
jgi:hypothetical protein